MYPANNPYVNPFAPPQATPATPVIYVVDFFGSYYTQEGTRDTVKNFELKNVKLNERMVNAGPLSCLKNEIAPTVMPRLYPDFKGLRKYHLGDAKRQDGQPITNIHLMNYAMIKALIKKDNLPIDISLYKNVEQLKQAVLDLVHDQLGFLRIQSERKKTMDPTAMLAAGIRELNPELFGENIDVGNQIIDPATVPSIYAVLQTKAQIEMQELRDAVLVDTNTTGYAGVTDPRMNEQQVRGMIDQPGGDSFPDGVPTEGGRPIKNILGTGNIPNLGF